MIGNSTVPGLLASAYNGRVIVPHSTVRSVGASWLHSVVAKGLVAACVVVMGAIKSTHKQQLSNK
jgi:hypothetical protein